MLLQVFHSIIRVGWTKTCDCTNLNSFGRGELLHLKILVPAFQYSSLHTYFLVTGIWHNHFHLIPEGRRALPFSEELLRYLLLENTQKENWCNTYILPQTDGIALLGNSIHWPTAAMKEGLPHSIYLIIIQNFFRRQHDFRYLDIVCLLLQLKKKPQPDYFIIILR